MEIQLIIHNIKENCTYVTPREHLETQRKINAAIFELLSFNSSNKMQSYNCGQLHSEMFKIISFFGYFHTRKKDQYCIWVSGQLRTYPSPNPTLTY